MAVLAATRGVTTTAAATTSRAPIITPSMLAIPATTTTATVVDIQVVVTNLPEDIPWLHLTQAMMEGTLRRLRIITTVEVMADPMAEVEVTQVAVAAGVVVVVMEAVVHELEKRKINRWEETYNIYIHSVA